MSDHLTQIDAALAEIAVLGGTLTRLETALEHLRSVLLQHSLSQLPRCDVPPTDHRREHRPGIAGTIDSHPELQAFIAARLDRLTFKQIADEIADHFLCGAAYPPIDCPQMGAKTGLSLTCNVPRPSPISARPLWHFADQMPE